jgi:hypothetical protein
VSYEFIRFVGPRDRDVTHGFGEFPYRVRSR